MLNESKLRRGDSHSTRLSYYYCCLDMTTKYREDEGAQNDINYSEELRPLKKISKKAKKKLIKSDNLVDLMDEV